MGYHWVNMNQAPFASWIDRFAAHPLLISFLIFALALALRLLALNRYVTPDELVWVYRSVLFREAIRSGQWANTLVAGHPGVITTWLGTAALSLQLVLQPSDMAVYTWITRLAYLTPDNMEAFRQLHVFLDSARTAVAVINSLGVVAVFWLVRELLSSRIALVAAFLIALDPFIGGLSGLFHVDGLLMTWSIVSLLTLALGVGVGHRTQEAVRRIMWLALSGATAALTVLSKSPGLILLPVAALAIFSMLLRENSASFGRRFALMIGSAAVWLSSFVLILLLLYPALWSSPLQVFSTAGGNASRHVEEALRPTFFMGDVAFDPGPMFYPVVLLWRLSPLVIGGLLLLIIYLVKKDQFCKQATDKPVILLLLLWVLLFLIGISFAAKKFDRYILPVIPALAILAAIALGSRRVEESRTLKVLILLLTVAYMVMLATSVPYLLSAYNPLVGGPYSAQYVLPLGWGESVSASGRWLANTSDAEQRTALSGIAPSLAPFFPGTTLFAETSTWHEANQIILTANSRQVAPQSIVKANEELELSHTVQYGLLPQAWIYNNPAAKALSIKPEDLSLPVSFDGQVQLLGQDLRVSQGEVLFTPRWHKEMAAPLLIVKIQLQDVAGNVWQELEAELLNERYFYPQHWGSEETPVVSYRLDLPPAMPPGTYLVKLSLVDRKTNGQLPVRSTAEHGGGVVYDAGTVELDVSSEAVDPGRLEMTPVADAFWFGGDLRLLGVAGSNLNVQAGGEVPLELIWQADGRLPAGLQLALQLNGTEPEIFPLSGFDSGNWKPGTVLRQIYSFPVPGDMRSGDYEISLTLLDSDGEKFADPSVSAGIVNVEAVDRLYALPKDIAVPLEIRYEPGIVLRGVSPGKINAVPGEPLSLTLYWQTEVKTKEPVTAFIHILDSNGSIVAQADRWPGGVPSNIWSQDQVIIDEYHLTLPEDMAPGDYRIVTGLYTASNGKRLRAFDNSGENIDGDLFILPLVVSITE